MLAVRTLENTAMITLTRVLIYLLVSWIACESALAKGSNTSTINDNATILFHILFPFYGRIEGRFDRVRGQLKLDENNPTKSKIVVVVDTASINSNHRTRDAYLRSSALLSANEFPKAYFRSDAVKIVSKDKVLIKGQLTLRGVTQPIIVRSFVAGKTFQGTTSFHLSNFGIDGLLGVLPTKLHLTMRIEDVR